MPVDALPAAFSVPSQVETIGALAGLAAILGLAVLAMLYFAQARELKRLREWAGRAPERAAEVQERAMQAVPRRTPQPMPTRTVPSGQTPAQTPPPPTPPPTPKPATPGAPGAPGAPTTPTAPGTGKPATAAATAAAAAAPGAPTTPANGQTGTPGAPATPGEAKSAESGEAAKPPTSPADSKPALDDTTIGPPPETDADTGDQPTTAQPAPRPAVPQPLPVPVPVPAAGRPPAPATRAAQAQRPRTAQPLRSTKPSATIPPRGGGRTGPPADGDGRRRGLRIGLIVAAIALVLAAGVFAFTQLTGGDDGGDTPGRTTPQQTNTIGAVGGSKTTETDQATQPKGETTVAVLNGTTVPGLARAVADKLENAGYKIGNVTNAPDQQRAATQVAYQQGQERTARTIARTIDVGSDAVVPIDEVTEATAGGAAVVVVTVGADQSP